MSLIGLGNGLVLSGTVVSKSDQPFWTISIDQQKDIQNATMAKCNKKENKLI